MFHRVKRSAISAFQEIKTVLYSFLKTTCRPFLILCGIFAIAFFSVITANFFYEDDSYRHLTQAREWSDFSRYTTEYSSILVNAGTDMIDITPVPQIIAIILLALSGSILLYVFKFKIQKTKITIFDIITASLLALCPYFLECISYKFDSPYMALSIFASIFPLLFFDSKKSIYLTFTTISTLIMCTTYQASSGIFPIAVILVSLNLYLSKQRNLKQTLKFISLSATSYLLALLIFKFFIMTPYSMFYATTDMLPLGGFVYGFFKNLRAFYATIFTDFRTIWLLLVGIIYIGSLIITVVNSKQPKLTAIYATVIALIFIILLTFGIYPALEKTMIKPRSMYSFGVVLSMLAFNVGHSKNLSL